MGSRQNTGRNPESLVRCLGKTLNRHQDAELKGSYGRAGNAYNTILGSPTELIPSRPPKGLEKIVLEFLFVLPFACAAIFADLNLLVPGAFLEVGSECCNQHCLDLHLVTPLREL